MVTMQDKDVNGVTLTTHASPNGTSTTTISYGVNSANATTYSVKYEPPVRSNRRDRRSFTNRFKKKRRLW